jgi:hypothetical protein
VREYEEHLRPLGRTRWVAFAAAACTSTACVFWDAGSWSNDYGRSPGDGGAAGDAGSVVTLASLINTPWGIAVDAQYVFFTSSILNGSVYRCSKEQVPCASPTVLASGQAAPSRMAIDSESIYWGNYGSGSAPDGSIASCPKTGCGGQPTLLATGVTGPVGIAVDAANVYWVEPPTGNVSSCPKSGCGTNPPTILAGDEDDPFAVAVDSTGLYWVTPDGDVRTCQPDSCTPHSLAKNQDGAEYVGLYDGGIYWTTNAQIGSVSECSETNCSMPSTLTSVSFPDGIAVDGTGVYWVIEQPAGSLMTCPLTGCGAGPKTLASGQGTPFGIALDSAYVYFTDSSTGAVVRVAKPSP